MAGVYDLELMFEKGDISTAMRGQAYLEQVLGDDKAALRARSPAHHADAISAAVLLAHGDLDERAPIEHAHRMRRALRKAGNPLSGSVVAGKDMVSLKKTTGAISTSKC